MKAVQLVRDEKYYLPAGRWRRPVLTHQIYRRSGAVYVTASIRGTFWKPAVLEIRSAIPMGSV